MKKILGIAMAFAMAGLALRAGVTKDPISAIGLLVSVFAWGFVAFSPRLIEHSRGDDDRILRSHTFIMGRTTDDKETLSMRMNIILVSITLVCMALALFLGMALQNAHADAKAAHENMERWKRLSAKAYTGYLLATSPVRDGLVQLQVPKGARYENGWLLPPDDFCANGLMRCEQPK